MDATSPLYGPLPAIEAARVERNQRPVAKPAELPEIDLSVVTYQSERWLPGFFASLAAQTYDLRRVHLHGIDHSPEGACVPLLQQLAAGLGLAAVQIEARPNRGFGAGHNRTLARGSSPYVLVTNVDLVLAPDALAVLARRAAADPAAAGWEARQKPYEHPKAYDILTQSTGWASSACILWRREALAAVGGYDEHFFMYGEDVDLSGRLRAAGWQLRYVPEAVAWHETYEEPALVKDTQYFGGTLGNFWLRLRFGSAWDIVWGAMLQLSLLLRRRFYGRGAKGVGKYWRELLLHAGYFFKTKHHSKFMPSPPQGGEGNADLVARSGTVVEVGEGECREPDAVSIPKQTPTADPLTLVTLSAEALSSTSPLPHMGGEGIFKSLFTFKNWDYTPHRIGAFVPASRAGHEKPLVSIIVRTYPGRGPLLEQALTSLANQTWPNLEVVVVEDGGETVRPIIECFRDTLAIIFYPAPKAGRCQSGNLGLALANGALIGFLDDDDLLFADHVETLAEALLDHPDYPAAHAYAWEVATHFTPITWLPLLENPPLNRPTRPFDRSILWANNTMPIQSVLFRRALPQTYGGFSAELPYLEDWDLWLRYAQAGDFLTVPKTTSLYRVPVDPAIRTARMQELAGCREIIAARRVQLGEAWIGFTPMPLDWRFKVREWLAINPKVYRYFRRVLLQSNMLNWMVQKFIR
jgi:GT2 family glycosyltransferase